MLQQNLALAAATTGFGLGAGVIFSIGPQNLKLIQAGAARRHAAEVATAGYASEIVIVAAGVCGIGGALQAMPAVKLAMQVAGVAFLLWCAVRMLAARSAQAGWRQNAQGGETRGQAVLSMLVMTWLNPLVYVEIMLLVGVLSSRYDGTTRVWFAVGFLAASCVRFCGLPAVGRMLAPRMESARMRGLFSCIAGSLLLIVAASQAIAIA